jgi:putative membrane protein
MFIKKKISLVYASKHITSFKNDSPLHLMIVIYMAVFIILAVRPVERFEWWFENLISFIVVITLAGLYRKNRLTNSSYVCILILLVLHAVGAHYTYSFCPIGDWMKAFFGFKRNNFDRLVSLAFGLLSSLPMMETLYHRLRLRYIQTCLLSSVFILALFTLYELAQMYSLMILSQEQVTIFLGLQGDLWDTQNDMTLGLVGSVITMSICILHRLTKKHKIHIVKN